jgi:hypothetical protein
MKTILLILIVGSLGLLAWIFWGISVQKIAGPEPANAPKTILPDKSSHHLTESLPGDKQARSPSDGPQVVNLDQLVLLRGTVLQSANNLLVVKCDIDPIQGNVWNIDAGAGAGAGEIASLAKLEAESQKKRIEQEFGTLERVKNGKIGSADVKPKFRGYGKLALRDYPKMPEKLNVIAVATGEKFNGLPVYTVEFKLPAESLPPPATGVFATYPPGVDTPEKRREYLLQQIEAKKNGAPPAQRTSNRTRGY